MQARHDRSVLLPMVVVAALLFASAARAGLTDAPGDRTGAGGLDLTGFTVKYNFTGVTNSPAGPEATAIHCTNVGSAPELVAVQMFQWNGSDVWEKQGQIQPGRTMTFVSQLVAIYFDDVDLSAGPIFQGSGRVLTASKKGKILCIGQVLDPVPAAPTYLADLPLFPVGKEAKPTLQK